MPKDLWTKETEEKIVDDFTQKSTTESYTTLIVVTGFVIATVELGKLAFGKIKTIKFKTKDGTELTIDTINKVEQSNLLETKSESNESDESYDIVA